MQRRAIRNLIIVFNRSQLHQSLSCYYAVYLGENSQSILQPMKAMHVFYNQYVYVQIPEMLLQTRFNWLISGQIAKWKFARVQICALKARASRRLVIFHWNIELSPHYADVSTAFSFGTFGIILSGKKHAALAARRYYISCTNGRPTNSRERLFFESSAESARAKKQPAPSQRVMQKQREREKSCPTEIGLRSAMAHFQLFTPLPGQQLANRPSQLSLTLSLFSSSMLPVKSSYASYIQYSIVLDVLAT